MLIEGLKPGPHGPHPQEHVVEVNRNRLARSTVALTRAGVSQRNVTRCLEETLDSSVSLGWVNGELAKAEAMAAQVNAEMKPQAEETLSGDQPFPEVSCSAISAHAPLRRRTRWTRYESVKPGEGQCAVVYFDQHTF